MTEPQQNAEGVQQSTPEVAQPAPQNVSEMPDVAAPPPNSQYAADSPESESDTFHDDRVEVGDIVVDSHNRPVLVLDVNNGEGGAVTGVAFNLDGTTEVVTERPE